MRWRRLPVFALLLLPVALAGCRRQSLSYEKTVTVDAGDAYQAQTIDPPTRDQKVTVTVSSTTAAVSVYLVLEKDREAAQESLRYERAPANVLAKMEKVQGGTLEATVPAHSSCTVLLAPAAGKTAQVALKITGR
jgi:hypothetical protein